MIMTRVLLTGSQVQERARLREMDDVLDRLCSVLVCGDSAGSFPTFLVRFNKSLTIIKETHFFYLKLRFRVKFLMTIVIDLKLKNGEL
jgi:hypothetical protein